MLTIEDIIVQGRELPWAEQERNFSTAIVCFPDDSVILPAEKSSVAELYFQRGVARGKLGLFEKALDDYQKVLGITEDPGQKALVGINKAEAFRVGFNDLPSAHASIDEALVFIDNGTLLHALAVDQRGLIFQTEGNYETALACYRRAIEVCEGLLNGFAGSYLGRVMQSSSVSEVLDRLGQVYQHQSEAAFDLYKSNGEVGSLRLAIEFQEKTMDLFTNYPWLNSADFIVNAKKMQGLIAYEQGQAQTALNYYLYALDLATTVTKYLRDIGIISLYVTECLFKLGRVSESASYLETFRDRVNDGSILIPDYHLLHDNIRAVFIIHRASSVLPAVKGLGELSEKLGHPLPNPSAASC